VQDMKRKIIAIAQFFLDAAVEELEIAHGEIVVTSDPGRRVAFAKVAEAAYGASRDLVLPANIERGLAFTRSFDPPHQVFGHGAHLALVQVDPETGLVQMKKYFIVEDCGTILDHVIVDGQVMGGAAQGIGNALFEELKYDAEGQLLTGSLMDYLVPTALDMPEFRIVHTETPSPFTPGGVKGVGEAGTVGAYTAVANAVADALLAMHVELTALPVSPQAVWGLINTSQAQEPASVTTPSQA